MTNSEEKIYQAAYLNQLSKTGISASKAGKALGNIFLIARIEVEYDCTIDQAKVIHKNIKELANHKRTSYKLAYDAVKTSLKEFATYKQQMN